MTELLPQIVLIAAVVIAIILLPRLNDERPAEQRTTEELRLHD